MIVGSKIMVIILPFFAVLFAIQYETVSTYESGMNAYRKGQYDLAIQEFESILSNTSITITWLNIA